MAVSFSLATTINHHRHHHHQQQSPAPPSCNYTATSSSRINNTSFPSSSSAINLHRSFPLKRSSRPGRCHVAGTQPEPPSKKNTSTDSGITATFARFKDTVQIFFAVLFWMSLFFWSSAWDGGNSGGRRNKGSRFRK